MSWKDHHLDGPMAKYLTSAGKPMPNSRVKIVDEDDQTLGPGEYGEICAKGKHIMMGYWKNPKLTEAVLKGGWYHTGDMGYMDEDGYIFMTDRKADMIISGGENVYPKEVEDIIYQHPAVRECTVVSAPDAKWGEVVQAVVVLNPDSRRRKRRSSSTARRTTWPDTSVPRRWPSGAISPKPLSARSSRKTSKRNSGKAKTG